MLLNIVGMDGDDRYKHTFIRTVTPANWVLRFMLWLTSCEVSLERTLGLLSRPMESQTKELFSSTMSFLTVSP